QSSAVHCRNVSHCARNAPFLAPPNIPDAGRENLGRGGFEATSRVGHGGVFFAGSPPASGGPPPLPVRAVHRVADLAISWSPRRRARAVSFPQHSIRRLRNAATSSPATPRSSRRTTRAANTR